MKHTVRDRLLITLVLLALVNLVPTIVMANPPQPDTPTVKLPPPPGGDGKIKPILVKPIDRPNLKDAQRNQARQLASESGMRIPSSLNLAGNDRVLVILVEYAGTDVFTWTAPITPSDYTTGSRWDPYGKVDSTQAVFDGTGAPVWGDCSKIITQTKTFTYTGPLHNQTPRPATSADADGGSSTWTPDFSPDWFKGFMFGNGVVINYNRTDGSPVSADFTGKSVKQYYQDFSSNTYNINGDVVGWVQVPHSSWYYGGDYCPGGISASSSAGADGAIPGAAGPKQLVRDALNAVNAISNTIPGFNWANYDLNGDGVIDRLWIVHAGYGEEEGSVLNRVLGANGTPNYGESAVWSHSSSVTPQYPVDSSIKAGPYIIMPENGGIGVFAHEYAHNLGAKDLYAYGFGNTSAGFWTLMADDWTGYPIGFQPPAPDPLHLDNWGWLNPKVIVDPNQVYTVNLGQASNFPGTANTYRGVKIQLPNGQAPLSKLPWQGSYYWWGGKADLANGMMTTRNSIAIPGGATTATLTFDLAYDVETDWDFMFVQVSEDGGATWPIANTLTNTNTACTNVDGWVGALYGFPDGANALCAIGLGGFTGFGHLTQATQTFDLSKWIGKSIKLRFWYMTDWGTTGAGPFVDNVGVQASTGSLLFDNAENQTTSDANWAFATPWQRSNGHLSFSQNYYLQWRNVSTNGGYDSALADSRWRYGPANTGLLVWYNNNFYTDNEVYNYLQDWPSFGPKGKMLVIDSHPDPVRNPASAYPNAIANWTTRSQMRDATFSLSDTVTYQYPINTGLYYSPRPAVSTFDDGLSYYPGLEYTLRGASPCTTWIWSDKQWDTSAVVPGRNFYSTKTSVTGTPPIPPATLTTGTGIRMRGYTSAGTCQASWYGFWYVPYADANNTGNPVDSNADFGWRVQIISQNADGTGATVKIWNTHYQGAATPSASVVKTNDVVTMTYRLPVNDGVAMSLFACVSIDASKSTYIDNSATNGATPLSDTCANVGGAAAQGKPLSQMRARTAATTMSVGWFGYVNHGDSVNFAFSVKPKIAGTLNETVTLYRNGSLWQTLPLSPVKVNWQFIGYYPFITK
ncbi:MAG: immune inhibitor A [Chloroflexi bacterium]|nr:immune inhibitor A [Chloroflexota bacterium]